MVVRMRHTRGHTANRRSHHALAATRLSACVKCNTPHVRHRMCENCGTYREHEMVDVVAKAGKKAAKVKARGTEKK